MAYKHTKQYRLYGYDYSQDGAYFITIVTKDRIPHFGEIENGTMKYNAIGDFVVDNIKSAQERKKDLIIGEWVVMPNHVHFLISIKAHKSTYTSIDSIQPLNTQSISAFINHFKGRVKKWCLAHNADGFEWQSRFHDRVVRNTKEHNAIIWYIQNNISNWQNDNEFFQKHH